MPYGIKSAGKGKGWTIYNKNTGKKVAHSSSKKKAQAYVRIREGKAHRAF